MDIRTTDYLFKKYVYNYNYPQPSPSNYFNRVYLCIEKQNNNTSTPIEGFYCYRHLNLEDAEEQQKKYYNNSKINTRICLIPICKWVPYFLDRFLLNYKLKKQFWLGKHTLYYRKT
jgi:hypothetical protein